MSELITVIFDANGGGITVSNKRVTVGEPYGSLPPPSRFGYEFDGWFTAEEGGEPVSAETIVTADTSHALYAHWTKQVRTDEKLKAYRNKKASLKRQKAIVAATVVLAVLVIIGLCVVGYLVNRTNIEDVDGTIYKIIKKGDTYVLCDSSEIPLPMTEDGKYYVTDAGSQVKLDTSTGTASIYAYVDTVGKEVLGNVVTSRVLAFPQVERTRMARIEVHNQYGTYAFIGSHKNGKDTYYIEGSKDLQYDQEKFASLIVSTGYVLAMSKIDQPVVDANGEYSEYGLVAETRIDAQGNEYQYEPAWFCLTDIDGEKYTVIVGDQIVSGSGYYVQYINEDYPDTPFIYIVSPDIANTVLQPIESLVSPMIVYPMTLNSYFNVETFTVAHSDSEEMVMFSFVPIEERMNTMNSSSPYVFLTDEMKGLRSHSSNVDTCLQSFVNMTYVGVTALKPDDEAMITYGVANPAHVIYFKFLITGENGKIERLEQTLLFSELTDRGTHYIYSALFDMIVEVERRYLPFLEYDSADWVDSAAVNLNIASTDQIVLVKGDTEQVFKLDNSDSAQYKYSEMTKTFYNSVGYYGDKESYYVVKRDGKYVIAEGSLEGKEPRVFMDTVNYLITPEGKIHFIQSASTTTLDLTNGRTGTGTLYITQYDKNLDHVLFLFVDHSTGEWGSVERTFASEKLRVYAEVDGAVKGEVELSHFRHLFQTLLYATIEGESELTAEQRAELDAKADSEAELVMTIKSEEGDFVFRFFRYSERKVYFTINGYGNYYMLSDRVEKIWNDAVKVIAGQDVTATDKN